MPIIVFLLLAVVCLAMLALACACFSDQPAKAADRATSLGSALPALVEVWTLLAIVSAVVVLPFLARRERDGARASPVLLQRFLF